MDQIGVLRAEWLTQIANAIESAQGLAWQLRTQEGASGQARELYNRLEAARAELESFSGGTIGARSSRERDWLSALGWSGALADPED